MTIDLHVVLNWHAHKPHYLARKAINGTDVSHTKHDKLLILINVKLLSKVAGMVRNGVKSTGSPGRSR